MAEEAGQVVGWARVSPYSERRAYRGVGEATVYVERGARGGGVGGDLLDALALEAQRRGFWKLIGRLFASNEGSRALMRRTGFREVGVHLRHARLDGEWRDVILVERLLGPAHGDRGDAVALAGERERTREEP